MWWPQQVVRVLVVLGLNAVPIWGFFGEQWSPGTTLALYWFQSLVSIPITAVLIELHRRATHKAGHYSGTMTKSINGGAQVTTRTTFLSVYLLMSIPFVLAHGVFVVVIVGLISRAAPGGVDYADLRVGAIALLNVLALGFAVDLFRLSRRPFAWVRQHATVMMARTAVMQFTILIGMAIAVWSDNDALAFFRVFLVLKLMADLASELPQWNPKEAPVWFSRAMDRITGPGSDFAADWRKERLEELASFEADERVDLVGIPRR